MKKHLFGISGQEEYLALKQLEREYKKNGGNMNIEKRVKELAKEYKFDTTDEILMSKLSIIYATGRSDIMTEIMQETKQRKEI